MGRHVSLAVEMRRFKCVNRQCRQAIFSEPINALALLKQRRTVGLDGAWRPIAQALGGAVASRLSATLGIPTSRDTLLRGLRRLGSEVTPVTPVMVGIDDWAITRGHRYGTIVVDPDRRCPIEVLDGREATSVADWRRLHPSIKVVGRDRAGAYSEAVQKVIPHAQQVADRWHLLAHLRETVERLVLRHNTKLREAAQLVVVSPLPPSLPGAADGTVPLMAWQKLSIDRRAARLARYEEVVRLRANGLSFKAIGRATDLDQRTVSNFLRAGEYPERSPRGNGPTLLDAYRHHIR